MKYNIDSIIDECLYGNTDFSQHTLTMFALICSLKPKNILELGVRQGISTRAILAAAHLTNANLTSVDLNYPLFICPPDYIKNWKFYQSDAIEFLKNNNSCYDLIFIDDWHGSEHVYKELNLIKKFLKPENLVLLHDLMHSGAWPQYNESSYPQGNEFEGQGPYGGVKKFVEENKDFEFATIPTNHGLTILRKIN